MIFLDASVIICLVTDEGSQIIDDLEGRNEGLACSEAVRLELLGFPGFSTAEKVNVQRFFAACRMFPIDEVIISRAIGLRQGQPISTTDAIVAATALQNDSELWATSGRDFSRVDGLRWYDPLAHS